MAENVSPIDMHDGLRRYKEFCKVTHRLPSEYVMQASRFFGPGEEYLNQWLISAQAKQKALPTSDDDLAGFAVDNNLHAPGMAPQHLRNPSEYRKWIQERIGAACV